MSLSGKVISASALSAELGARLKQARLDANLSQDEVATRSGLSRRAVQYAEAGKSQLESFLAVLIALGQTAQIDNLLPPSPPSPLQLIKLQGQKRQRAGSKRRGQKAAATTEAEKPVNDW